MYHASTFKPKNGHYWRHTSDRSVMNVPLFNFFHFMQQISHAKGLWSSVCSWIMKKLRYQLKRTIKNYELTENKSSPTKLETKNSFFLLYATRATKN